MFKSCELLENTPKTNEGLEKGMNFMTRDVAENSGESKKFRCCRQCCHFVNPLDPSKFLVASLMPFSRPSLVSNMFSLSL